MEELSSSRNQPVLAQSGHTEAEPAASFTPGPWQWDSGVVPPDGPGRYADIYVDGGETIIAHFNELIPEGLANARLIAAAPELYEALRWFVDDIEGTHTAMVDFGANVARARAALAKVSQ